MGLWDKLGLVTKCEICGFTQDLQRCSFCNKTICGNCLKTLVLRKKWPDWFIGKKIHNFEELKKTVMEYKGKVEEQGGAFHICNEYLRFRWSGISKSMALQRKRFDKEMPYEFHN